VDFAAALDRGGDGVVGAALQGSVIVFSDD
jgi:hypothetical protein